MPTLKKPTPPVVVDPADLTTVRKQGLELLTPLKKAALEYARIDTPERYLLADETLGRIRNTRKRWGLLMAPVTDPIQTMKNALKLQEQAVKRLNAEVDGPLEQAEMAVKEAMRQFKLEERRQLEADEAEKRQIQLRLEQELQRRQQQEEAAKTPALKARLAAKREEIQQQIAQTEQADLNPTVKGAASSARTIKRVVITDLAAFITAMVAYEPKAGIYQMGHPPLSLITPEMLTPALGRIHKDQPGVVLSWPGVEIEEDINIAGR